MKHPKIYKALYVIILIIIMALTSCGSKKKVTEYKLVDRSEEVTKEIKDTAVIKQTTVIVEDEISNVISEITEETEFEIITNPVSGNIVSVPKSTKTTTKTSAISQKTKEKVKDITESSASSNLDTSSKTDIDLKSKESEKKKGSNSAIVHTIYLTLIAIVLIYIFIKRYFPSIFVKIKRIFTL